MPMSHLGPRLAALARHVLPGRPAADIGTDHGRLPAALLLSGHVPTAVGIDLRPEPLATAWATAAAHGLVGDPRLELRLGSGLAPLSPGEVATVCIAGMGGLRILDLLRASPGILARLDRLVLQPNTDWPTVRAGLVALGWRIVAEELVEERGHFYVIEVAQPGEEALSAAGRLLGPRLLEAPSPAFRAWLEREERRLVRAASAAAGSPAAAPLQAELALLRSALR